MPSRTSHAAGLHVGLLSEAGVNGEFGTTDPGMGLAARLIAKAKRSVRVGRRRMSSSEWICCFVPEMYGKSQTLLYLDARCYRIAPAAESGLQEASMFRSVLCGSAILLLAGVAVRAQPQTDFDDGTSATILRQRLAPGPAQGDFGISAVGLPFFTAGIPSFNRILPITFVGGNPSVPGTGTSTIPVVIVPLLVNFLDGSGSLDATGIVSNTIQSPLFTPTDFNVRWPDF